MLKLHKFHYILSGGVCVLAILLTIFYCSTIPIAHAADPSVTLSVDNSDVVLELTVPSSATLNLTPSSANGGISYSERNIDVSAGTNNIAGYTLTMRANSSALTRTNSITDGSGATSTPTIPSVSGSYALNDYHTAQATINTWACALPDPEDPDAALSYTGVPTTDTRIAFTRAAGNANTTTVSFTAKVDSSLPAGTYATTLNFVAVTNVLPEKTLTDINNMQDMTMAICGASEENETKQLKDTRDGKYYWVTKLKDGNCWMTQNLDLGDSNMDDITLTPADSDVATNFTLTAPGTTSFDSSHYDVVNYRDPGEQYYVSSGTTSNDTSYTSKSACEAANSAELCQHSYAGNYYNWYTATAGTGTQAMTSGEATSSICPKGWRLPTNSSAPGAKSYYSLLHNYDIISSGDSYTTNGFNNIRSNPLYFVRSGYYYSASLLNAGYSGYYWSSTVNYSYSARALHFNSVNVYPQGSYYKYYGFSVRCLARNIPTDFVLKYDQNAADTVASMPASQTLNGYDGESTLITISSQVPTRSGYYFGGWATSKTGDAKYLAGVTAYISSSDMPTNGTLTLYAKWYNTSTLIDFAIDGKTYLSVPGFTWKDWLSSTLNTDGYCLNYSGKIVASGDCDSGRDYNYIPNITIVDVIAQGASYSTSAYYSCFLPGTLITLSDGNKKKIEDMTYDDKVLVWNFDEGRYDEASIAWLTAAGLHNDHYYKLTFSDGTVLKTTGEKSNHKVFNADEQYFQGVSSIEVGTHVYTENGIVTLVDKEYIEEDVEYYNVITTTHFNVFANGVLTGNRYDNMYDIADMKYVKDGRTIRPYSDFEPYNIDRYWYDTLRLGEQSDSMDEIVDYIHKLESQMRER